MTSTATDSISSWVKYWRLMLTIPYSHPLFIVHINKFQVQKVNDLRTPKDKGKKLMLITGSHRFTYGYFPKKMLSKHRKGKLGFFRFYKDSYVSQFMNKYFAMQKNKIILSRKKSFGTRFLPRRNVTFLLHLNIA